MASEERNVPNIRNKYYDKMGFRAVEEKKSMEAMLFSDTIDVKKMTTFCLKFSLPIVTRPLAWKVLLTVLPPHRVNHEFVYSMRCQQFDQLIRCLRLLDLAEPEEVDGGGGGAEEMAESGGAEEIAESGGVDENADSVTSASANIGGTYKSPASTTIPFIDGFSQKSLTFLQMYLLEEGQLGFANCDSLSSRRENRIFMRISNTMAEIYDDDKDAFFAAVCFFKILATKYDGVYHLLPDCLLKLLKQLEGDGDRLQKHLHDTQFFRQLPYAYWFRGCFAGVIPSIALDKIWDKVIAGSCMILVHVAVAILLTMKRPLLTMKTAEEMTQFLTTIPSDSAEIIVSRALDSWYKTPTLLPVIAKEDSPVIIDRVPS